MKVRRGRFGQVVPDVREDVHRRRPRRPRGPNRACPRVATDMHRGAGHPRGRCGCPGLLAARPAASDQGQRVFEDHADVADDVKVRAFRQPSRAATTVPPNGAWIGCPSEQIVDRYAEVRGSARFQGAGRTSSRARAVADTHEIEGIPRGELVGAVTRNALRGCDRRPLAAQGRSTTTGSPPAPVPPSSPWLRVMTRFPFVCPLPSDAANSCVQRMWARRRRRDRPVRQALSVQRRGVQRRRVAPSAATPCSAQRADAFVTGVARVHRSRPKASRPQTPRTVRASQVARRGGLEHDLELRDALILPRAGQVADLLRRCTNDTTRRRVACTPAPTAPGRDDNDAYVGLRDSMSARSDSHRDALDGEVFGRDLDEMEIDAISERSPLLDAPSVHGRGQSRLEGEALPEVLSIREPAQQFTACGYRMRQCRILELKLVRVEESDIGWSAGNSCRANVVFPAPFAPECLARTSIASAPASSSLRTPRWIACATAKSRCGGRYFEKRSRAGP